MTDEELALHVLRDIESKPKGSVTPESAMEGHARLLSEMRKHPEGSRPYNLFRAAAFALLGCAGLRMTARWEATDLRSIPLELLEVSHVKAFKLAWNRALGYPVEVPGLRLWATFERD